MTGINFFEADYKSLFCCFVAEMSNSKKAGSTPLTEQQEYCLDASHDNTKHTCVAHCSHEPKKYFFHLCVLTPNMFCNMSLCNMHAAFFQHSKKSDGYFNLAVVIYLQLNDVMSLLHCAVMSLEIEYMRGMCRVSPE